MAAAAPSAVAIVDQITAQVAGLALANNAGSGKQALPTQTKDCRWWPIVPPGHTAYTFFGIDEANPAGVSATSTATAAPAASSGAPAAAAAPKADKPAEAEKPAVAKEKKAPAPKAAAAPAKAAEPEQPEFTKLDIRVGQIVKAARHPNPEVTSLYVEMIDVGDAEPRQVLSGLVKYIPLEQFQTMRVCVVCNLKPGNLMGEISNGMVLAASIGEGDARVVELVQPPEGSKPGDRIVVLDESINYSAFQPMEVVDGKKKDKKTNLPDNPWARTAATLKTNDALEATWNGMKIGTKAHGPCKAPSLKNAQIA